MGPCAPRVSRARIAPREIFGSGKVSAGTSVQSEPIYVVIPLRVDRSICGMHAALRDKLYCRTEPAYPPRAGPCGPPRSPPRRGGSLFPRPRTLPAASRPVFTVGDDRGRPPHPPAVGFADGRLVSLVSRPTHRAWASPTIAWCLSCARPDPPAALRARYGVTFISVRGIRVRDERPYRNRHP